MKRVRIRSASLAAALLLAASCGGEEPMPAQDLIGRDVFVDTYVDLRATAVRSDDGVLDDDERARILARHEVTEEDLFEFARVHGDDPEWMRGVWDEIEDRLDAERLDEGSER